MEGFGARVGKEEEGWWRYIGSLTAYLTFPRVKFEVLGSVLSRIQKPWVSLKTTFRDQVRCIGAEQS